MTLPSPLPSWFDITDQVDIYYYHSLIFRYLVLCRSKSSTQVTAVASAQVAEQEAAVAAAAVPDWVYDPNEPRYCLCNQVSECKEDEDESWLS